MHDRAEHAQLVANYFRFCEEGAASLGFMRVMTSRGDVYQPMRRCARCRRWGWRELRGCDFCDEMAMDAKEYGR